MLAAVKNGFSNCMQSVLYRIENDPHSPAYTGKALVSLIAGVALFSIGCFGKLIGGDNFFGTHSTPMAKEMISGGKKLVEDNLLQAVPMGLVVSCLAYWKWFWH